MTIKKSYPFMGLIVLALLSILLSGCRAVTGAPLWGGAATPETAAVQSVINSHGVMPNFQLDANSVKVQQSIPFNDHFLVVVAFRGFQMSNDAGAGPQRCMFTYEVLRARVAGWSSGSGGGSCTGTNLNQANLGPMSIGASNNSGGGPGSTGYSTVDGEVYQEDIVSVLVTWDDGQVDTVQVVNGTYITVRPGQHQMMKVDGLDEAGQVLYTSQPQTAPGKK